MKNLKISGIIPNSLVNGPGIRYVLFLSGCSHKCEGCHNPHTWDYNAGKDMSVQEIIEDIKSNLPLVAGITISGGEPFDQSESLLELLENIKSELNINIWCYTGYTLEDVLSSSDKKKTLKYIDTLIDGKFEIDKTEGAIKYTGSTNQRIINLIDGNPDHGKTAFGHINFI